MSLSRPTGAALRALALALAAALTGATQLLVPPDDDHGHRCTCPAGAHACACPRCASAVARARTAHPGTAADATGADANGARPCCHRPPAAAPAHPRPLPDAPCVSAACGGRHVVAALSPGADPFVPPQHPLPTLAGRGEKFAPLPLLADGACAAPEPPPPRS